MPFPSGSPARYGNVRPTDYRDALEHSLAVPTFKLRTSPFTLLSSVPASRFHTAIHGVRLCLRLGVHALAIPVPSSLANAKSPGDSSRGRILLRHCDGIVPSLLISNFIDNETANALRAESIGTFTQVPPDLTHHYFGHVYCPAGTLL